MSAIDSLTSSSTQGSTGSGRSAYSTLSSEDFAKIIFTELSKQDPLQPNDTNALLNQISSIRSIQSNMDLSNSLSTLVAQNEFASASSLVGKTIGGLTDGNDRVTGVVRSVSRTFDGSVAELADGSRVSLSRIDEIRQPSAP